MSEKTIEKVEKAKQILEQKGIIYQELANGQLQVDTVNFWSTSEKYYDTATGEKGKGINRFLKYLSDSNII